MNTADPVTSVNQGPGAPRIAGAGHYAGHAETGRTQTAATGRVHVETGRPAGPFASRCLPLAIACLAVALIAGCGSSPRKGGSGGGGGYYKDDGPGHSIPRGIENIPDAVPRIERHNPANFRPYSVMGQRFVPVSANTALRQKGVASWYGRKFHGQKTANGETYDMYAMTAAHPTLPLPSYARVTHAASGRSVIVRVNDRGPFLRSRVIDLSYAAAAKLGIIGQGSDVVTVEAITHAHIRQGLNLASSQKAPTVTVAAAPATARPAAAIRPAPASRPAPPVQAAPPAPAAPVTAVTATVAAPPADAITTMAQAASPAQAPAPQTVPAAPGASANAPETPETPDALAVLAAQAPPASMDHGRTPPPTVTDEAAEGIYLQFGAFGSYISADRLANRLNAEIAHVESRSAHIKSNDELHRVRIGPYATRTAAVNAAVRIQEATGMQPTLAQR